MHDRRKCPKATGLHAEKKEGELQLGLAERDLDETVHVLKLVVLSAAHLLAPEIMLKPAALSG